ncbi:hypothetical protein FRB94_008249 [Tulasnella sp. JGI-2019a]|nr:hypothetical protein FRB94_008249 [Tulasnella sp. JGI-2019a]
MAVSKASRRSLGRKPTNAEWVITGVNSLRNQRRRQKFVKDVKAPYKDKHLLHRSSIAAEVKRIMGGKGDTKLINKAITDLAEDKILLRASNRGHFVLDPTLHDILDEEFPALPDDQHNDPIAISNLIRRQTQGGRAPSQYVPSPSPGARKRRRTSMGRPHRLANGDDSEEDEVALQVTPAPKRRARTSFASRRASIALPPNTDPKDRRKTKAELLEEIGTLRSEVARQAATPLRIQRIHDDDEDNDDYEEAAASKSRAGRRHSNETRGEQGGAKTVSSRRANDDDEDPFINNDEDDDQDGPSEYYDDMQLEGGANDDQINHGSVVAESQTVPTPSASSPIGPSNARGKTISGQLSLAPTVPDSLAPPQARQGRTNSQISHHPTPAPSSSPPQHDRDDSGFFQSAQDSLDITRQKFEDEWRNKVVILEEELRGEKKVGTELRALVEVVKEERDREKLRVTNLTGQVDTIKSRLEQAQAESKADIEHLTIAHADIVSALQSELEKTQATSVAEIMEKADQVVAAQEELEQTQVRMQMVEQELDATKSSLADANVLRAEEKAQYLQQASAAAIEAEQRVAQMTSDHEAAITASSARQAALETELSEERVRVVEEVQAKFTLQQANDTLTAEVRGLEEVIATMQAEAIVASDGLRDVRANLEVTVATLAEVTAKAEELTAEKAVADNDRVEMGQRIASLQDAIVTKDAEVLMVRQTLQAREDELGAAREHINGLNSTLSASRAVHLQLTHDIAADHARLADIRKQLDGTRESNNGLKASVKTAMAQIDGLHKELSSEKSAKNSALDRLETARQMIDRLERQLSDEGKTIINLGKKLDQWKTKFENAEAAVMALHSESSRRSLEHKEERKRLRGDLKAKEQELAVSKMDLQKLVASAESREKAVKCAQDTMKRMQQAMGVVNDGFKEVSEALNEAPSPLSDLAMISAN